MQDNNFLIILPSEEKIRWVVFGVDAHSALGLNISRFILSILLGHCGFGYCECCRVLFSLGKEVPSLNSNFMVLVPKISEANQVDHSHPTVLGKFYTK